MKYEIIKILEMQNEGKLTKEQAAELLAILADQAREKTPADSTQSRGAPGPRGGGSRAGANGGSSTFDSFVDTVAGVGAQVGRTAAVVGGEIMNMVHRDEGGNTVTLSKLKPPAGEAYSFRGNSLNASLVGYLTLNRAHVDNNTLNASKLARLSITDGRFSQCALSGSSVDDVTIQGTAPSTPDTVPPTASKAGIRGVAFLGTKFARTTLRDGSFIDACTIQGAAVKDVALSGTSEIHESRINDSTWNDSSLESSAWKSVNIDHSTISSLTLRNSKWESLSIAGTKMQNTTFAGTTLHGVRIRPEGGRSSVLDGATFENCQFSEAEFIGCTFKGTTIKNVAVSKVLVRGVNFGDQTIDGEEEFRKAASL